MMSIVFTSISLIIINRCEDERTEPFTRACNENHLSTPAPGKFPATPPDHRSPPWSFGTEFTDQVILARYYYLTRVTL